jgi:hypothetical protein
MKGAGPAGKVAAVGQLKARKQGNALPEYTGAQKKTGKVYRPVHNGNASRKHASAGKRPSKNFPG